MKAIRTIIADDNDEIRGYFQRVLSRQSDIEVIGTAANGAGAVSLALQHHPDVVIMDIEMDSQFDGIEAIESIKRKLPDVRIVVLTVHKEDEYLFRAYSAGAMDYLIKTTTVENIINAVRQVYQNQFSMRPEVSRRILAEFARLRNEKQNLLSSLDILSKLTNAEIEIIKAVYHGYSYSEIAKARYVERGTVKTQANKILKKFQMKSMHDIIGMLQELDVFRQLMKDE